MTGWFIKGVPDISITFLNDIFKLEWVDIVEYTFNEWNDTIEIVTATTHQECFDKLGNDCLCEIVLGFVTVKDENGAGWFFSEKMLGKYITSYVTHADNESPVNVKHIFKVLR